MRKNKSSHEKSKTCLAYQKSTDIVKQFVLNYKKSADFSDNIMTPYKNSDGEIIYLSPTQVNLLRAIKDI
jgi:hypothetical protein